MHFIALVLTEYSSNWLINIDKGESNLAVFLDIKKAFDTTDHEILLNKLNCCGISDAELDFYWSHFRNRKQCWNINGYQLYVKTIKYSVPQGWRTPV